MLLSSDLERDGGQKTTKDSLNLYLFYEIRTWTKGNVPQEFLVFVFVNLPEKWNSRKC
jgi:hypothetical protein